MLGQSELALLIDNRALSKLSRHYDGNHRPRAVSIAPQNVTHARAHYNRARSLSREGWTGPLWTATSPDSRRAATPLNIGTYVGAAQVREAILGDVDRAPTSDELEKMKALALKHARWSLRSLTA